MIIKFRRLHFSYKDYIFLKYSSFLMNLLFLVKYSSHTDIDFHLKHLAGVA